MTLRSSASIRSRPSATFSALAIATDESIQGSLMREGVDDLVDAHPVRQGGELDVAGVLSGVRPFPAVAHVGVPVDEDHGAAGVIEDGAQVLDHATFLPGAALQKRSEAGHLREAVHLVETAEN